VRCLRGKGHSFLEAFCSVFRPVSSLKKTPVFIRFDSEKTIRFVVGVLIGVSPKESVIGVRENGSINLPPAQHHGRK